MFDDKKQEPEDIFKNTEPTKPAAPSMTAPAPAPVSEPTLKTPPPFFMKKNGVNGENKANEPPIESLPSLPPEMSPKTFNQKNLIFLILIIVVALAVVGGGIWWFFIYKQASPLDNQPPVNLFENQDADKKTSPDELEKENEPAVEPPPAPAAPDTDGDGLTDAEEAALGTSINSADTDNDGLYDREEVKVYKTDPLKGDTDDDGLSDGDEVRQKLDPLSPNAGLPSLNYKNTDMQIELTLLDNMVLEASLDNILQFNDNANQIKLYIYKDNQIPISLKPDWAYAIDEDDLGQIIIKNIQKNNDETPYSTEISTLSYQSVNGHAYLIYYTATLRAPDHQAKFETFLKNIKFLK